MLERSQSRTTWYERGWKTLESARLPEEAVSQERQMKRRCWTSRGKERVLGKGKTLAEVPRQERDNSVLEPRPKKAKEAYIYRQKVE